VGPENDDEKLVYVGERRKKKADPKDAINLTPMIVVIVLGIMAVIVVIVMSWQFRRADLQKIDFLEKRGAMIVEKLDHIHLANVYRDRLKMSGIKLLRSDDSVTISATLSYSGDLPIADVFIEVYFLDGSGKIISHETYRSVSDEGQLLTAGGKRTVLFTMPVPSADVKDIRPVIMGISRGE